MGSYRHLCCIYSSLRLVPFASLRGRIYFFNVIVFMLHRVIEWVDFSPIFKSPAAFVVVAVGMWATRLRCPSCAQRCLSYGHDLIEGGAALLIAISMTDEGPMESCDATIALAACR